MAVPIIAIMAAMAAAKAMEEKKKEEKQRRTAAEQQRYSPWTDMASEQITPAGSLAGGVLQGAATGAMMQNAMGPQTDAAPGAADVAGTGTPVAPGQPGAPSPNYGTPANAAMQRGQFPQYYNQQYMSPWTKMGR